MKIIFAARKHFNLFIEIYSSVNAHEYLSKTIIAFSYIYELQFLFSNFYFQFIIVVNFF